MKIITVVFSLFIVSIAGSKEKYAVDEIPSKLLPADAVIRDHSIRFEVKNKTRAVEEVTYAVTIYSKNEREKGELVLFYDKFSSIEELEGTMFDDHGDEIRDLDNDIDVKDYSAVSNYSLYDDSRVKHISMYHDVYPYTVEFKYEILYKESFNWPMWMAQDDKFPVQFTQFEVILPAQEQLRYWCNRDSIKPIVTDNGNKKNFMWKAADLELLPDDISQGDMFDASVIVRIAPREFEVEGYKGSMENWKQFGSWIGQLYRGRNNLPDSTKKEMAAITSSAVTSTEKVKRLYEYLQLKTRYVSIQLGIGSWQPFDAMYVHNHGYGDCKALTNYMESLLSCINIPSFPVLINSGTKRMPMITEFPSNQFNHVILCVPLEKDSIWLECTSQSMPFGRLGYSTENRSALLISPSGGIVVQTPKSRFEDNVQQRTVTAAINSDGNVYANITTMVSGDQQIETQYSLINASKEDQQKWMLERFEMPNISLTSFSIEGLENKSPEIKISIDVMLHKYSTISANRIFVNPSVLCRTTYVPAERKQRISPVRFSYPYRDADSIYFSIPKNYAVETIPKDLSLQTSFGSFHCKTVAVGDSAIVYTRITDINTTSIPALQYNEYRTFFQNIVKADRSQVVLKKK
jgi:hypothetical protein